MLLSNNLILKVTKNNIIGKNLTSQILEPQLELQFSKPEDYFSAMDETQYFKSDEIYNFINKTKKQGNFFLISAQSYDTVEKIKNSMSDKVCSVKIIDLNRKSTVCGELSTPLFDINADGLERVLPR